MGSRISRGVYTEAPEEASFRSVVTKAWEFIARAGAARGSEGGRRMPDGQSGVFWPRVKRLFSHQRAARQKVSLPVDLQHATGVTRDFSPTGVYFETDLKFQEGSLISFTIDFDSTTPGEKTQLECTGRVVRVDLGDTGKVGVAVKLEEQHLRTVKR